MERALEVQKEVCVCYVDYTKAFDKVRHDEMITRKRSTDKKMSWERTGAIPVDGEMS